MFRTVCLQLRKAIIIAGLAGCTGSPGYKAVLPYYNTPDFTPVFANAGTNLERAVPHHIGTFSCINQHAQPVTDRQLRGKVHIASFMFTRCNSICPTLTSHLKKVQQALRNEKDLVLLSYSVTPWIDSVERLRQFAASNDIDAPNWHLLTGSKSSIYTLARQSYFAEEDLGFSRDSTDFLHTEHVLLVDRNLRIRGIYNGTLQLDMEQMTKDARTLLAE